MSSETQYLSVTETAKLIRKRLAQHFPGVKFSVRSHSYSMGASINIRWTDGPASRLVDPLVRDFAGGGFDSMNDLSFSKESWLLPDGSATLAFHIATGGSIDRVDNPAPHPDAIRVRFGSDYVHTYRVETNWEQQEAEAAAYIRQECSCDGDPNHDRFGNQWVSDLARSMVRNRSEGEDWEPAFKRVVLRQEED